jgi:hypothetical protein
MNERVQGMGEEVATYVQGIRENLGQFSQQLLQVFFVA